MITGCYLLDLYCDAENKAHKYREFPHQFTAETGSDCRRQAREKGWKLNTRKCIALCPKCRKSKLREVGNAG